MSGLLCYVGWASRSSAALARFARQTGSVTFLDKMATTLRYNFVGSAEENGVLTVGFADDEFESQEYLMFQNRVDANEAGGGDEIYIERDDQQQGTHGGVERLVLSADTVLLQLSPETANAIDTEQEVTIFFSAAAEQFQQLKLCLERVFAGTQILELR